MSQSEVHCFIHPRLLVNNFVCLRQNGVEWILPHRHGQCDVHGGRGRCPTVRTSWQSLASWMSQGAEHWVSDTAQSGRLSCLQVLPFVPILILSFASGGLIVHISRSHLPVQYALIIYWWGFVAWQGHTIENPRYEREGRRRRGGVSFFHFRPPQVCAGLGAVGSPLGCGCV